MRQKWFRELLRRRIFIIIMLGIQGAALILFISNASKLTHRTALFLYFVSVIVCLKVVSSQEKPTYKLLWVFLIMLFPIFGGLLYLLVVLQSSSRNMNKHIQQLEEKGQSQMVGYADVSDVLHKEYAPCMSYLNNFGFPAYQNTECMFFPTGESAFIKILEALKNAKHYIFLEYFIIQDGKMWSSIYSILKEKAKQGVRIRVLYDDIGCFLTLPKNFPAMLHDDGIECKVFNPFRPILSSIQNNRDHRKILSVDGRIAITGGFNLADEYINEIPKHGYWKDTGILLSGEAAWSLTVMFLQMWDLVSGTDEDYTLYLPPKTPHTSGNADGFVQPYCDSPLDREHIGEHVYLQIINNAREYLYIYSPYLIVDDSMISALTLSAKSGVDVRIITPYHWDKHFVHLNTQAYYRRLIESGVKVYEYEPGFLHAKVFVSHDKVATVGSINMDYRSLYLHFECGVYLYKNNSIGDIKRDFLSTLKVSRQITLQECQRSFFVRLLQEILRLFAPLF